MSRLDRVQQAITRVQLIHHHVRWSGNWRLRPVKPVGNWDGCGILTFFCDSETSCSAAAALTEGGLSLESDDIGRVPCVVDGVWVSMDVLRRTCR